MIAKTMTDIVSEYREQMQAVISELGAEHQRQVQELTQRIGELCKQVNERDALIREVAESGIEYTSEGRYRCVQISESLWNTLLDATGPKQ